MACNITITSVTGISTMPNITDAVRVVGTSVDCQGPIVGNTSLDILVTVTCGATVPISEQQTVHVDAGNWEAEIPIVCDCQGPITVTAQCVSDPNCNDSFSGTLDCDEDICPSIDVSLKVEGCNPNGTRNVTLTRTITSLGTSSMVILQWEFGDGQWSQAEPPFMGPLPDTLGLDHPYVTGVPYTAFLHIIFPTGCPPIPLAIPALEVCELNCPEVIELTTDVEGCADSNNDATVTFTGVLSPPIPGCTFQWDFGDGSPDQVTTTPDVTHVYSDPGTYSVAVTAICDDCIQVTTIVVEIPACCPIVEDLSFSAPCYEEGDPSVTATFVADTEPPSASGTYSWDFGDSTTDQTTVPTTTHNYDPTGSYTATVVFTPDDPNCDASTATTNVSFEICVIPPPCHFSLLIAFIPLAIGIMLLIFYIAITTCPQLAILLGSASSILTAAWIFLAIGAALIGLIYLLCLLIPDCTCPDECDWQALAWMLLLTASLVTWYFSSCCTGPWWIVLTFVFGLIASALFGVWVRTCGISCCKIFAHLQLVFITIVGTILIYVNIVFPAVAACRSTSAFIFIGLATAIVTAFTTDCLLNEGQTLCRENRNGGREETQ